MLVSTSLQKTLRADKKSTICPKIYTHLLVQHSYICPKIVDLSKIVDSSKIADSSKIVDLSKLFKNQFLYKSLKICPKIVDKKNDIQTLRIATASRGQKTLKLKKPRLFHNRTLTFSGSRNIILKVQKITLRLQVQNRNPTRLKDNFQNLSVDSQNPWYPQSEVVEVEVVEFDSVVADFVVILTCRAA